MKYTELHFLLFLFHCNKIFYESLKQLSSHGTDLGLLQLHKL